MTKDEDATNNESAGNEAKITAILDSAPPPYHSQALMVAFLAFFVYIFPSLESLDDVATVETFTNVLYPEYMSVVAVGWVRIIFGSIALIDCIESIFYGVWDQQTDYDKGTKLKTITVEFRGLMKQKERSILRAMLVMAPFTMISFFLLGVAFFLSGLVTLMAASGETEINPWLLRMALLSFECSAPTSLLISAVVKYALWPMALEAGSANTQVFKETRTLFEHNGNVIMCLIEVGLLGGLPIRFEDMSVAPLWGIAYVYFSWFMSDKWGPKEDGPQYIYPFFDTTMGWMVSISLVVLLLVLGMFYAIFAVADHWIAHSSAGIGTTLLSMVVIVLAVCRFRD